MKIAYLGQMADVSRETSIAKKIRDQLRAWSAAGHECHYFALARSESAWAELAAVAPCTLLARGPAWLRPFRSRRLCRSIEAWRPDLVYFRYAYHEAGLPASFSRLPAVAELNSDDTREYALTLGPAKALYHRLTRQRLLGSVAGFVPVTRELARLAAPFAQPVEVVANGIDFSAIAPLPPPPADAAPRLAFIGSPRTPWHGLERVAELARLFPDWGFDIIGDDRANWSVYDAAPPPANLLLHGQLPRERYLPIVASATVALGTFGLYRKSMQEACPLKVREYLALGLPVIGACADTDIPDSADYYLRLPNDASPLAPHREAIAAFVERWQGCRVPRVSVAHLDVSVKETRRLAFMHRVASDWRAAHGQPALPA
jgi:glycosyltransferase involved in cell wall biosynthesis